MTTARHIHTSTTSYASPSSNSDQPANRDGPSLPDETSPLLKPSNAHSHQPSIPRARNSALLSFFDDNAGLLLVASSQVFFSAMNLSVKVLNSLDEPVPTFEVRSTSNGHTFPELTSLIMHIAYIGPNGTSSDASIQKTKAYCKIGNHNCLLGHIHVRSSSSTFRDQCQSLSGIGRKSQTHFLVPRVFGLYWCSEGSAGASFSSGILADLRILRAMSQVLWPLRDLFLLAILVVVRCDGVDVPSTDSDRLLWSFVSQGALLAQGITCRVYACYMLPFISIHQRIVFSFVGVVLIARPQFLFGKPQEFSDPSEVTPTQRMLSVMSEGSHPRPKYSAHLIV